MGKRSWLNELLEQKLLPTLAKLPDTDEGKAQAQELNHWLRLRWTERGHKHLNQQQSLMDQTRAAIKSQLGDTHFALEYINFTTEEYTLINDTKQQSVALRNEDVKQIDNPDAIVAVAVSLLDSCEWADMAAGLAVLTGRRSSELLATAQFQPLTEWSVTFTGALKRRGETQTLSFEIPTLTNSDLVFSALAKIRHQLPDAQHLGAAEVNSRYGQAVVSACDRHFAHLVPARDGGNLYTHLFRAVYATIATFWFCPPKVDPVEFRAAIQGHYAVLDQKNPELRRSLAASRHYSDFEIADRVIASVNGQRKGIKLGINGVEPIQAFKNANIPDPPTQLRKHPSTLRIWSEDRHDLAAVLAHFPGHLQADKITAWIAWSQQMFREQSHAQPTTPVVPQDTTADATEPETVQVIQSVTNQSLAPEQIIHDIPQTPESVIQSNSAAIPVHDSIQSNPETTLEPSVSSSLEAKLDGLVTVMTQFIQLQMLKEQQPTVSAESVGKHQLTRPPESNPPPATQTVPTPTTPRTALEKRAGSNANPLMDGTTSFNEEAVGADAKKKAEPSCLDVSDSSHLGGVIRVPPFSLGNIPDPLFSKPNRTPQSPNKTGHDDQVIHAAIDAIIAHNNRQQLHDLKWEITINTLKAFSRNQRAIERILGRGKDNPLVARIVGTREDEIANHHQLHHILSGHNHRHKRHRKIADVLSNGDSLE